MKILTIPLFVCAIAGATMLGSAHAESTPAACRGTSQAEILHLAAETEYAASIHREYLAHPDQMNDAVGGAAWQRRWADTHDRTAVIMLQFATECP